MEGSWACPANYSSVRRLFVLLLLLSALPGGVAVAGVPNDDIADAAQLTLPRVARIYDVWAATVEPGEPSDCIPPGTIEQYHRPRTVWFRIAVPHDAQLVGTVAPYFFPNLAQDSATLGAFRDTGGFLELLACSSPTSPADHERIRVAVTGGEEILLQVVCQCAMSGQVGMDLTWGAPNDRRSEALTITDLPFSDDSIFLNHETVDADEPSRCRGGPFGVPSDPIGTVWYEYVPPVDEDLRITTRRPTDGVDLSIFERDGDSLHLVACVGGKQRDEYSEHRLDWGRYRLDAEAGHTYLFQVHTWALSSSMATFTLRRVPGYDLTVDELAITPGQSIAPSREISFRYGATNVNGFVPSADYRLVACPLGQPDAFCDEIASDHLAGECCGWTHRWVSHRWGTTGCVGDWEIRVVLIPWFDVDPDVSNNERRSTVGIPPTAGSGIGSGRCGPVLL